MGTIESSLPTFNTPSVVTKQLGFNVVENRRKARLSTNFLLPMGFTANMPIKAKPLGEGKGFVIEPAAEGEESTHIVYKRSYSQKGRSNNPLELVVEFGGQEFINSCFPKYIERFHVEMRMHSVKFTPVPNRVFSIINRFRKEPEMNVMTCLTGGVDIHAMEKCGWKTTVVLEDRPREARDIASGRNLSEVHALNTIVNGSPKIILNESIHDVEMERLHSLLNESSPVNLLHFSLGCDDVSNAKAAGAKQKSIGDLSTMIDMVYPALKINELIKPVVTLVENVRGFRTSPAGVMMTTTLRRFGYNVTEMVLNGLDYGAVQGRERYYMVASCFPDYEPPRPVEGVRNLLWPMIEKHLGDCRDITDTSLVKSRENHWRNMPEYLTRTSTSCATIMKSQDRVRDAVFIKDGGRVYRPSEGLLKELMSIPKEFDVSWMAKEQATETLGQSIDYALHHAVIESINKHLTNNIAQLRFMRQSH